MCGLDENDEAAGIQMGDERTPPSAASVWKGDLTQELQTWKWSIADPTTYSCKMNDHWKLPNTMKALGLDGRPQTDGGNNACYRVEHWNPKLVENGRRIPAINQWYTVDGIEYQVRCHQEALRCHNTEAHKATQAHYEFGINLVGGGMSPPLLSHPH